MRSYVGLSGLACACIAWLALELTWGARIEKRSRLLGAILLVGVASKIGWDVLGNGQGWLVAINEPMTGPVRVARYAHLAGAVAGALCWAGYAWPRRGVSKTPPCTAD